MMLSTKVLLTCIVVAVACLSALRSDVLSIGGDKVANAMLGLSAMLIPPTAIWTIWSW